MALPKSLENFTLTEADVIAAASPDAPENVTQTEDGILVDGDGVVIGDADAPEGDPMTEGYVYSILKRIQRMGARAEAAKREASAAYAIYEAEAQKMSAEFEARPDILELQAVVRNGSDIHNRLVASISALLGIYDDLFRRYALANLDKRSKTLRTCWGNISLRRSTGTLKVVDQPKAVSLAKALGLANCIKESVNGGDLKPVIIEAYTLPPIDIDALEVAVSQADPEWYNSALAALEDAKEELARREKVMTEILKHPGAFDLELPCDKVTIDTGVENGA